MGWIKGKGPRFEDGTVSDGMQELGAQIEGGQKSRVCHWVLCWDAGVKAAEIWKQR